MNSTSAPINTYWEGAKAFSADIGQIGLDGCNAITNIPAKVNNFAVDIYNFVAPIGNTIIDPIATYVPGQFGNGHAFPEASHYPEWNWSQSILSPESDVVHQSREMVADILLPLAANKITKLVGASQATRLVGASESTTIESELKTAWNIWDDWDPKIRGRAIENLWGRNLPKDFPGIDHMDWTNGVASSFKSINLQDKTYQKVSQLRSTLKGYVNNLAEFKGASVNRVEVLQEHIQRKVLKVAIPPSTRYIPSQAQAQVLQEVHKAASEKGIRLIIEEVGG